MAQERQLSCVARLFRIVAYKQMANVIDVAGKFSPHRFKNERRMLCVARLFCIMALRTTNVINKTRLFQLMT